MYKYFCSFILIIIIAIVVVVCSFFNLNYKDTNINMGSFFSSDKNKNKKRVWKEYQLGHEREYAPNKPKSKFEQKCYEAAIRVLGGSFKTVRPDWLKNPKTGKNLEIDIYCDKRGIGIEAQGYQHIQYPNKYHKSEEEFKKQVERDNFKHKKCEELGIYLLLIYDDCENIEKYIYDNVPKQWVRKSYKPS